MAVTRTRSDGVAPDAGFGGHGRTVHGVTDVLVVLAILAVVAVVVVRVRAGSAGAGRRRDAKRHRRFR